MTFTSRLVLHIVLIATFLSPCLSLAGESEIKTSLRSNQGQAAPEIATNAASAKVIVEKDETGKVVRKFSAKILADGSYLKHGEYVEFHDDGKVYRNGQFQDGKRNDVWKYFDEDGDVVKTGRFADGLIDGVWNMFSNGKRIRLETYHLGVPHGRWERFSMETEMVLETREFKDGKLHGTVSRSYPNGQPREHANYENGKLNGVQRKWHSNGKQQSVATYSKGMRHGSYKKWHPNGTMILDARYQDDQLMFRTSTPSSP